MSPLTVLGCNALVPSADAAWETAVPAHVKRRDPRIWKMAYAAAAPVLSGASQRPRSLCVATALGALDETKSFLDGIFTDGFGSPRNFIASVHNSMAGKLALEFSIDGPNLTLCDGPNSFASAIASAALLSNDAMPCLVVAVDESIPLLRDLAPFLPADCGRGLADPAGEGAVALLVTRDRSGAAAAIRALAPVFAGVQTPEACAERCARQFGDGGATRDFVGSGSWFLAPAMRAHAALHAGNKGRYIVTSYSTSSMSCAAIEVCV